MLNFVKKISFSGLNLINYSPLMMYSTVITCSSLMMPSNLAAQSNYQEPNEQEARYQQNTTDPQQTLSSLTLLQSLKVTSSQQGISSQLSLGVPHVQEIFNPEKVRTLFVASHQLPIVDIQLTFNAGSARDESIAKGLFGVSHLTARMLNEGTTEQSSNDVAKTFESLGAEYSAQAYRDMFIVKLRVMSDPALLNPAVEQLIRLLKDANFPQSSLDRLFDNAQVGQQQVVENPTRSMSVRFYRLLYGNHPYAEPTTGTSQSLKRITSDHLHTFRDQFLVRENVNIAITGNLTSAQASHLSSTISAQLKQGQKAPPLSDARALSSAKIFSSTFDSSQAYIMIGQLGIRRDDSDRFALEVGNEILGGSGFNSLLMKALREKRGYTYSVSSQISSMLAQGTFSISYSTRSDQLLPSLAVAYQTLFDFIQQPLDTTILEETKTAILRKFPQSISSNANINAQLGAIAFYDLPANYLETYPQYIAKITVQDVQQAWQKNLHPDKLISLVAGKNINNKEIEAVYQNQLKQTELNQKLKANTHAIPHAQ